LNRPTREKPLLAVGLHLGYTIEKTKGASLTESKRTSLSLHLGEAGYGLLVLAWFIVPLFVNAPGALVPPMLPVSFLDSGQAAIIPFLLVTCVVFPIPLLAVFKIVAPFLESRIPSITDPKRIVAIVLDILLSTLVLATLAIHLLKDAPGPGYFRLQSWLYWAALAASSIINVLSVAFLIAGLERRDDVYQEYLEFMRGSERRNGGLLAALRRPGIQKRLALTFLPFILAIIVVPSVVLLRDFRRTTLSAAIAGGETLAEQAALAVSGSFRDGGAIDEYFALQAGKNAGSADSFKTMLFARRNDRTGAYEFTAGTDRSRIGTRASPTGRPLDRTGWRLSAGGTVYEFTAPVTRMYNPVGFVTVEYARETITAPCFRITVKVLIIAVISVYAAVVLLYLFGRNLVHPILYLRMSVNAISRMLDGMVKGKTPVSASLLQYRDRVRTQDEVKQLSDDIRAMTAVIRGVLPYVSVSTLRHAERNRPKAERGSNRNLAFLFTDIRGFSSLCEEQHPDQIVKMLNDYLGIQAEIIRTNGGDIDKFVGDEIVAMFDGPKKELHACRASVEIRSAMEKQRELAELASRNVVSIGIGINTGPVVFGSIGAGERMDFTSIGDTVNLAARLEKANKSYRTRTLISEAVHDKVDHAYLCREIDLLTVKGKRRPIRVFELLQERGKASDRNSEIKRVFEEGLSFYRQKKWGQAEQAFGFLKEKFHDETSEIFLRRIALFRLEAPPRKWDGVFDLSLT
jgi:class 3 adenylate cyclase